MVLPHPATAFTITLRPACMHSTMAACSAEGGLGVVFVLILLMDCYNGMGLSCYYSFN